MPTNPFWLKGIRACHWQELLSRNKLWFSIIELDDPLLQRLLPGGTHRLVENFRVDQSHFWRSMGHPLLNENQTHSIVNKFNGFRVAKSMEAEMKEMALLITDTMFFRQVIKAVSNTTGCERIANQKAWTSSLLKGL